MLHKHDDIVGIYDGFTVDIYDYCSKFTTSILLKPQINTLPII